MKPRKIDDAAAAARYRDGATVAQIAAEQDVHPTTVWAALRRAGEPLRGPAGRRSWGRKLTRRWIERRRSRGMTWQAIADDAGCDRKTVYEWAAVHGLLVTLEPGQAARLRDLYEAGGLSIGQVAQVMGWSPSTARRKLVEAGVTLRPPGRPRTD